jgi:hypothetical protein
MEERECGRGDSDLRWGTTIYRPSRNLSVGGDLPQKILARGRKFWGSLKAENLAWGQKFRPPGNFHSENSGPILRVAPQLKRKDLAKNCRARNSGISGPRKFWLLRISGPFLQAAPHLLVKDLAKFQRGRNYGISDPQKFCQYQNFRPLY